MRYRIATVFIATLAVSLVAMAQTVPVTGLRNNTPRVHALTNATIVVSPTEQIDKGSIVVRDGVIEDVGSDIDIPPDARVWDCKGRTIYAGFIDLASDLGMPKPESQPGRSAGRESDEAAGASHWNSKVHSRTGAAELFKPDGKKTETLRSQGFALVLVAPQEGLFRGSSALLALNDQPVSQSMVLGNVAQNATFEQAGGFFSPYPNSLLGTIAFTRQTLLDANWYWRAHEAYRKNPEHQARPETNLDLAELTEAVRGRQPIIFSVSSDLNFLRAARIVKEFSLRSWIVGSGEEYRRIDAVKETGIPIIIPLDFPEPPSVATPEEAMTVTLEDLMHWDAAPENPGRLEKAGVPFVISPTGLKDPGKFLQQLRVAVERGLSEQKALAALTTVPAQWLGIENRYGSLSPGKVANFVIMDGTIVGKKSVVREVWIDGERFEVKAEPDTDIRGTWTVTGLTESPSADTLTFKGTEEKPSGSFLSREKKISLESISYGQNRIAFSFKGDSLGQPGLVRISGSVEKNGMFGVAESAGGMMKNWTAVRVSPMTAPDDTSAPSPVVMASFPVVFPPEAFGRPAPPDQPEYVFVKSATLWTQGPQGIIEGADMIVRKGKISRVGKNLSPPKGALIIDATGKHVSPGIIDAHSHTALSSINEGGEAITAETRTEDVIDPDDIWIYRQLAGGTTTANQLHGSANPIGGQNTIVKWRWGSLPDDLLLKGAPPGIKFALGENVKQSNFMPGGRPSTRYPQTRMGVDQLIRDRFKAAQDYQRAWREWENDKSKIPPRRDLELDALVEILNGKRDVHAHSYRQDEILMLIRIADDFGFTVKCFQHVLEGYKIAEAIARHGAGASTFSDWWAYKIEAWDAIPGNGPLMHRQGVVVSYNSDDSQLATRLNWEAAKALAFGISEQEALNFVTMNAAEQLGVASRIGSLEEGKDADFVVWSGTPLSTFSRCEQTWIDGKKYFDREDDKTMNEEVQKKRATLIQKILKQEEKKGTGGGSSRPPSRRPNEAQPYSCVED